MARKLSFSGCDAVQPGDSMGVRIAKRRVSLTAERAEILNGKQITQELLAELMGVSRETIKKWENGATSPSIENIRKLCAVLDCDYDYLFGDINTPYRVGFSLEEDTGLSPEACATIHNIKHYTEAIAGKSASDMLVGTLDAVLRSEDFIPLLKAIALYSVMKNQPDNLPEGDKKPLPPPFDLYTEAGRCGLHQQSTEAVVRLSHYEVISRIEGIIRFVAGGGARGEH